MGNNINKRSKIRYILENTYLEILLLYIMLIAAIGVPILSVAIIILARLVEPLLYYLLGNLNFLGRLESIIRILMSERVIAMGSLVFMLIIISIIIIMRLKKGIFLKTLLLYNVVKNYNKDFKIYTGLVLPFILAGIAVIYFLYFFFRIGFRVGFTNTIPLVGSNAYINLFILLVVTLITFELLNYAEQTNKIMHNINNIGSDKKKNIADGFSSEFTIEAINMLYDIDENVKVSIDSLLKSERLKTELITNISHDIKTPLTSIINFTDLLKNRDLEDDTITSYINALDRNSQRLKLLITDLVDAAKTETGNVNIHLEKLEINELISQVYGEFDTLFNENHISFIFNPSDDIFVLADGSQLGRVLENIIGNASKYTTENTRIYGSVKEEGEFVSFTLKNISKDELNITPDELMEQFVRGERSRHTEGSGLGLYIAKNLIHLMNGELILAINGDLFEAKLLIPKANYLIR